MPKNSSPEKRLHRASGLMRPISDFTQELVKVQVYLGGEWKTRDMVLPIWQIEAMRGGKIVNQTDDDSAEIQIRMVNPSTK